MVKIIILDFDGIIVNSINPYLFKKFSDVCGVSWQKIKKISMPYWISAATGKQDEDILFDKLEEICKIPKDKLRTTAYSFCKVNKNVIAIIGELKSKYKIILLSNHVPRWFNYLINSNNLKKYFDFISTSFDEKIYKSNKKIYLNILRKFKIKPEECLFIDNTKENLNLAKKLGIKTIYFKNAKQLKNELKRLKI